MTPLLEVDRVSKTYNVPGMKEPYCVFRDISLQIREGEFVSVIGHSGCGKSTLLNIIAGIDHADEGVILLKGAEGKYPSALSGGMKQRCGLARAFAVQPPMMLLDEPFAQIDALTRGTIQDELIRMWNDTGVTIFMVTHDVDEAILLSDRILLMSAGPFAEIREEVPIEIPRPRTRASIIEHPDYYKLRNRIIQFLSEKGASQAA